MSNQPGTGGMPGTDAAASGTQANAAGQQTTQAEAKGETPKSLDEWLPQQDEATQSLIDTHITTLTAGLKATVSSLRDENKSLAKQLKTLAKSAEQGSDMQKELERLAAERASGNQKADFFEEAHKRGATNLKLAYLSAQAEGLIDERGRVDFDDLKKQFPELFTSTQRPVVPPGNHGNGTREGPPKTALSDSQRMNSFIRQAAGKQ